MPIKPENKHRYPANWKEIRTAILERAGHRCEGESCGLPNHCYVYRDAAGGFCEDRPDLLEVIAWQKAALAPVRRVKVVLTIAHLDHTPENNDPSNLKAFCQKCHNEYDAEHRKANRAKTRRLKMGTQVMPTNDRQAPRGVGKTN